MTLPRENAAALRRVADAVERAREKRDLVIRQAIAQGASYAEVAQAVGLSKSAIAKITNREGRP
jgi:DNA-directed RNA polymerase specialized sigma24 family protein